MLVSSKSGRVFLPLDKAASYGFEDKLPVVSKGLFVGVQADVATAARKFLHSLGVRKADPADIIADYVLPIFEANEGPYSWKYQGDDFCIGSVLYIRDHLKEYQDAGHQLSTLTNTLWIKFIDPPSNRYWRPNYLYLTAEYGNKNLLENLLEGIPDACFLDTIYLERSLKRLAGRWKKPVESGWVQRKKGQEAEAWRAFFTKLGVASTIRVDRLGSVTEPDQAHSPHLQALFEAGDPGRLRQVANHLDVNWGYYREFLETRLVRYQGRTPVTYSRKPTQFAELLVNSEWVPAAGGSFGLPSEVHLDDPLNRGLLGESALYLGMEVKDQRLIDEVGIRRIPMVETVLERLSQLAGERSPDFAAVRRLYAFLDQNYEAHAVAIDAAFADQPLFCLPRKEPRYLTRSQVFWHDVGPIFGESRGCLSEHWADLKAFFVQKLEVPLRPCAEDYVTLLNELAKGDSLTTQQERIVWAIYRELDRHLGTDAENIIESSWWKEFVSQSEFWTERDEFWVNSRDLFVNDRNELYDLFAEEPGVAFIKLPDNQYPYVSRFLQAAGIPLLSEAVQIEMADSSQQNAHPALTARCRRVVPFILRYLFYREPESYRERERAGSLDALLRTEVRICDDLRVVAILCDIRKEAEQSFASRFPTIYVKRESESDLDGLAAELSRMLGGSPGLEMFIAAALSKLDGQAVERLMQAQGIPELPSDEEEPLGTATMQEEFQDASDLDDKAAETELPDECSDAAPTADDAPSEREDSSGRPQTDWVPAGVGTRREPALTAETASGDSQNGERGHSGGLFDLSEDDENEGQETGPGDRTPSGRAEPSRERKGTLEPTSTVWHPISSAETVAVRISDVVPPVAEERIRTTRTRSADGGPFPGEAGFGFEDSVPNPHALDIGRWGEQYAVSCLRDELGRRYPTATIESLSSGWRFHLAGIVIAEIRWLNWEKDIGVGCDIEVVEKGIEEYVEVKATSDGSKATFEVTAAQWTLARQHRGAYRILRVFIAGSANAFAQCYRDPYGLWEQGRLMARALQIVI